MKKIIILFSIIVTGLTACYKDKGNYDYNDINEITISDIENAYAGMTGIDRLHIEPAISMTMHPGDPGKFSYYWIVMKSTTVIDTIGTEAVLDYPIDLAPDNYTLHFRILDQTTGVVWKTRTNFNVGTPYSRGWMLIGEDENGNAEMEMLSMIVDTIHVKGILSQSGLPALKTPLNVVHTGGSASYMKLWAMTGSGSYYFDRLTMKALPANRFGRLVYATDPINKDELNPILMAPQIRDIGGAVSSNFVRAMLCSDGSIFASYLSLNGGDFYANPVNRDKENMNVRLKAAPYMLYPIGSMNSMVWYDTDNDRFMNYSSFILNTSSVTLKDNPTDIFPWNQSGTGRKLVYAENTRNTDGGSTNGNSFAVLKDNSNQSFIYKFYASGASPAKRSFYTVKSIATDFDKATFYAFSSRRTVVFYVAGNKLYAYDYNTGNEKIYQFPDIDAGEITMLKFDTQVDHLTNALYVATYNAESKGTLRRYNVGSDPNVVEITPVASWSGLVKVKNMNWRAVN
ncbi:MAG: PKD-like family lipoprotein [Chitinophagaceae bacterium]